MTTNPTPIPEPTSPTAVVVGKRNGETVVAARMDDNDAPWVMQYPASCFQWSSRRQLCGGLTDIRVVDVAEVAAEIDRLTDRIAELEAAKPAPAPAPGPWLRGDELKAVMLTLKAGDVVEVDWMGHTSSGELWVHDRGYLMLLATIVCTTTGMPGAYVDALRIIERAPEPEPGADIPDEVVSAACGAYMDRLDAREAHIVTRMRAALAAADAKRAELEGGEQA